MGKTLRYQVNKQVQQKSDKRASNKKIRSLLKDENLEYPSKHFSKKAYNSLNICDFRGECPSNKSKYTKKSKTS